MTNVNPIRNKAELLHLSRISALTAEIAAAVSAIERNDLAQLQTAITNQERICSQLANTKWGQKKNDPQDSDQLTVAYVSLNQLNRVYSGLVKRSKRSVDLMLALYGTLAAENAEPTNADTLQTLSCEA